MVLTVWQSELLTVMPLTILMVALVQSAEEDDDISLTGFLHGLSREFCSTTGLIETTAYGHTIVTLHSVAHIPTGEIHLAVLETLTDTVERQDLTLYLQ